eukprot:gene13588-13713_t
MHALKGLHRSALKQQPDNNGFKNKEKVLILGTRGINYRSRHLMTDFLSLIPHSKKDVKLDTKSDRGVINEVADEKNCSSVLFFEARKRQDLFLWMAKSPDGPTAKFLVLNIFSTPRRFHKAKPFFDHVISFSMADGAVWMRNYQVVVPMDKRKANPSDVSLVEVGPRCALRPIKIFEGSFGGRVIYDNPEYVPPNTLRRLLKQQKAGKYSAKVQQKAKRREHEAANVMPVSEIDEVFRR